MTTLVMSHDSCVFKKVAVSSRTFWMLIAFGGVARPPTDIPTVVNAVSADVDIMDHYHILKIIITEEELSPTRPGWAPASIRHKTSPDHI